MKSRLTDAPMRVDRIEEIFSKGGRQRSRKFWRETLRHDGLTEDMMTVDRDD